MDKLLNKIQEDITELKVMAAENSVVLKANAEDIRDHIKRTNLLEQQMQTALLPIRFAKWFAALIGTLAAFSSMIYTAIRLFGKR